MRIALANLLLAAVVVTSAQAETLSGQISFETKAGCEGLKTDIRIVADAGAGSAEIFVGPKTEGTIKTDGSGNFLERITTGGLPIAGSVKTGIVVRRLKKVSGGCMGKFKL